MDKKNHTMIPDRCREGNFGEGLLKELRMNLMNNKYSEEEFSGQMEKVAQITGLSMAFYKASECYGKGSLSEAFNEWERVYNRFLKIVPEESMPEQATCLSHMCLAAIKLDQLDKAISLGNNAVLMARKTPCINIEAEALGNLANAHRNARNIDEGIKCRRSAINIFDNIGDLRGKAKELTGVGNLEFERENIEIAITFHQKALAIVRKSQNYDLMPLIMQNLEHTQATLIKQLEKKQRNNQYAELNTREVQLGEEAIAKAENCYKQNDWQGVQKHSNVALEVFNNAKIKIGVMVANHLLAGSFAEQKKWEQALGPSQSVVQICKEEKMTGGLENGLKNLYTVLSELNDVEGCIACLEEHLELSMTYGMTHEAAPILKSLGEFMRQKNDYKRARKYQMEALALFNALNDQFNTAIVLDELSTICNYEGKYDIALDYSKRALKKFEKSGKSHDVAVAKGNRAQILLRLGDTASAAENFSDAVVCLRKIRPDRNLIGVLQGLGVICAEEMMFNEAIRFLEEAYEIAQSLSLSSLAINLELDLIELQIKAGGLPIEKLYAILNHVELEHKQKCRVLLEISRVKLMMDNPGESIDLLNEAILMAENHRNRILGDLLYHRGKAYAGIGENKLATTDFKNSIDFIEGALSSIHTDEHKIAYRSRLHTVINPYDDLINIYLMDNRIKDAFEIVEAAKGRVFLEILGDAVNDFPRSLIETDHIEILSKLMWNNYMLKKKKIEFRNKSADDSAELGDEIVYLQKKLDKTLLEIERIAPNYVKMRHGAPITYHEIRLLLK